MRSDHPLAIQTWGPAAWHTLHAFAHTSPEKFPDGYANELHTFLHLFGNYLPCPTCRQHFAEYIDTHLDASIDSRDKYIRFLNDAHNEVNRRRGAPTLSLAEHMRKYDPAEGAAAFQRGCSQRRRAGCAVAVGLCAASVAVIALRSMRRSQLERSPYR